MAHRCRAAKELVDEAIPARINWLLWSRRQLNIWFLIPLTKKKRTRMPRMCQTMKPILSPFALFPTSIKLSFSNNFFPWLFHNQSRNKFLKLIKLSGILVLSFSQEFELAPQMLRCHLRQSKKKSAVGLQIAVWLHESPRFSCQILCIT
jgi:hypothetical protein